MKEKAYRVSVIIPTFNRANLISKTIDSVLNQTFENFEILIVDDGSTDNTSEIIKNYQAKHGAFITYVHQVNRGVGKARNFGISMAQGEYLAFIDSDDLWHPLKLENQISRLVDLPSIKWIYTDAIAFNHISREYVFRFSDRMRQYEGEIPSFLIMENFIPSSTPLIHASLFTELGGFSDQGFAEDWEMWLRIASKYPVALLRTPLAYYRIHTEMATSEFNIETQLEKRLETIRRSVEFSPSAYERYKLIAESNMYYSSTLSYMLIGDQKKSREKIENAIRSNPRKIIYYALWITTFLGREILRYLLNLAQKDRDRRNRSKLRELQTDPIDLIYPDNV